MTRFPFPREKRELWSGADVLAHRNPRLLFLFVGFLLFRFDDRRFLASLFQEPPRITLRDQPLRLWQT